MRAKLLSAALISVAVAACGGAPAPKPPPPTPPPAQNCAQAPLKANGSVDRPVRQPSSANQKAAVQQAFSRSRAACPDQLKPPPPTIRGLPTGVPSAGVSPRGPPRFSAVATVEQFDSVDNNYPAGARYGAGYVNGAYRTFPIVLGRFGPCCAVGIDVFAANVQARATDLEPGNPGPGAAGPWAYWQIHSGGNPRPVVYTMGSWWSDVANSLAANGIPHCSSATQSGCYLIWIASWNYSPGLWAGMDCRQWTDRALGENLDESTCGTWMYSQASPPDPNYNPSFNVGYSAGVGGAYRVGYNADHHPKVIESGAFNAGFRAGYAAAKAAGQTSRHKVPAPTTYNASFNWGFDEGWAAGFGGTFRVWFGTLYATPTSRLAANDGYKLAYPKAFDQRWRAGFYAGKR